MAEANGTAPTAPESSKFTRYVDGLIAGEFDGKSQEEIAQVVGCERHAVGRWNKSSVDWEAVKSARRALYAQQVLEIDQAMLKAASNGDVSAAKIMYERFDGWIPTQALQHKVDGREDEELRAEAARIQAELAARVTPPASIEASGNPA